MEQVLSDMFYTLMKYRVEDIFRTEGIPEYTFVKPPNYNDILVDIRSAGKPTIIEGQSGTGKTTVAKKIIEYAFPQDNFGYLSARNANDISTIIKIANGKTQGMWIIDDFHRLESEIQEKIADIIKTAAEQFDPQIHPKLVLIGINKVGSALIFLVHDIAKRCGIHRIEPGTLEITSRIISKGEEKLNVKFGEISTIHNETKGDYWLTQLTCQAICLENDILETSDSEKKINYDIDVIRKRIVMRLDNNYRDPIKEFCRGKRFRPTNDPYYRLMKLIGSQDSSIVDLNELANAHQDFRGSINNIKETRINIVLESKPICARYIYYNSETKTFAIEDPAFFYYLRNTDWNDIRRDCGFREGTENYDWDFAISFAGENRALAKMIVDLLTILDCTVFYDEHYETNYLGTAWSKQFTEIFGNKSRYVICLLDKFHHDKIWPTFERDIFTSRVKEGEVIPIFLDETKFVGIPDDIVGIDFRDKAPFTTDLVTDKIAYKLEEKLRNA